MRSDVRAAPPSLQVDSVLRKYHGHEGRLAEQANVLRQGPLVAEANKWATEAMPQPGPKREAWVERMLLLLDAKLDELAEISGP